MGLKNGVLTPKAHTKLEAAYEAQGSSQVDGCIVLCIELLLGHQGNSIRAHFPLFHLDDPHQGDLFAFTVLQQQLLEYCCMRQSLVQNYKKHVPGKKK